MHLCVTVKMDLRYHFKCHPISLKPSPELIFLTPVKYLLKLGVWLLKLAIWPYTYICSLKGHTPCPPITNQLLTVSATQLASMIKSRQVRCVDVMKAYIERVTSANPVLNAVVQDRFELALQEAKAIDKLLDTGNNTVEGKPLLGVPMTVKESVAVKGMSNNAGRSWIKSNIADVDADCVHMLREAGAIPILVSNTPELCLCWETYNSHTGRTRNPFDTRRTPGGSSGGEAALLGAAGSVIGVGSDIGGSLRLPAMFTGVYGHKPTPGYISNKSHIPTSQHPYWDRFFTVGPMCRYAEDLPTLLDVMIGNRDKARSLRLLEPVDLSQIRVCYMENDGSILSNRVDPEIRGALQRAVHHLENKYGCQVEKVSIEGLSSVIDLSVPLMLRMNGVQNVYQKDEQHPDEWNSVVVLILKRLIGLSKASLFPMMYGILKSLFDRTSDDGFERILARKKDLMQRFQTLLGDNGVFLFPTFPEPAYLHNQIFYKFLNSSYCTAFNLAEIPSTACPLGLNSQGLPIGIQVAAWQGQDRLTMAVAHALEKQFGGWVPPPS